MNSMAWLALLVWIGVPILAGWMFTVLLKRAKTISQRKLAVAASIGVLIAPWLISSGVKWWYDQQVRELCAKDGGVKVYETVTLPKERFDKWGNVGISDKAHAKLADEYYFESEDNFYKQGNPKLLRSRSWVVRRSDGKVLGESIRYARSDGDIPGPWHGSSFDCPSIADAEGRIESSIFLRGNEK